MNSYDRDSAEYLELIVTVDGTPVTSGIEYAITTGDARPSTWLPVTLVDRRPMALLQGRPAGTYVVWARVTAGSELVVMRVDTFLVV